MPRCGFRHFCCAFLLIALMFPLSAFAIGEDDPLWQKPSFEKKVNQVGHKLMAANHINEEIEFMVSYRHRNEKHNVNAYANDRDNLVTVESGLLKYIESDDELAYILGHEIGHIIRNHGTMGRYGNWIRGTLITAPIAVATMGYGTPLGLIISSGVNNTLNQKKELEADRIGFNMMANAGYDPHYAISMEQKLAADGTHFFFASTHPKGKVRMAQVRSMLAEWEQNQAAEKERLITESVKKAPFVQEKDEPMAVPAVDEEDTASSKDTKTHTKKSVKKHKDPESENDSQDPNLDDHEDVVDP